MLDSKPTIVFSRRRFDVDSLRNVERQRPPTELQRRGINPGVSVVICTHNAGTRLRPTLEHLRQQSVDAIPWEVILVDNASTDDTARAALEYWPSEPPCPLRVVREPQLGLSHARDRGIAESSYEFVLFVDDDNWLAPGYVQAVYDLLAGHPDLGACGGYARPVTETDPPAWFSTVHSAYAVGGQAPSEGDVASGQGFLWGAGMGLRKTAYESLRSAGFRSLVMDRQGNALSSGGDVELSYVMRLGGWRLWYDPKLILDHAQAPGRLDWNYLRRLMFANGLGGPVLDLYKLHFDDCPRHNKMIGAWWLGRTAIAAINVVRAGSLWLWSGRDGRKQLQLAYRRGLLRGLIQQRRRYREMHRRITTLVENLRNPQNLARPS